MSEKFVSADNKGVFGRVFNWIKERKKGTEPVEVNLNELIEHPENYLDIKKIATTGYLKRLDKRKVSFPMLRLQPAGNGINVPIMQWISEVTELFSCTREPTTQEDGLLSRFETTRFSVGAPIYGDSGIEESNGKYELTGRLIKARYGDKEEEGYLFNISKIDEILEQS